MPAVIGGFAGVAGKLFEQLQVGEAQADDFDPPENLVGPRLEDGLGFVDPQLVRADQLHGALFLRQNARRHIFKGSSQVLLK